MTRAITTWLVGFALLGALSSAEAASFLDRTYGTPELGLSPRSRAMGGAGAALGNGAWSLIDNPATLALVRGSRFQGLAGAGRFSENRFVPLYDSFDSFVDETAIAVNDNGYGDLQGGVVVDELGPRSVILAFGIFNRYDARYNFESEERDSRNDPDPVDRDKILNRLTLETDGILRSATLGAAWSVSEAMGIETAIEVGAAVNYYFGTFRDRNGFLVTPAGVALTTHPDTSRITDRERKIDGLSFTFGGSAQINERLRVGASIETAPQLDYDVTATETRIFPTPGNVITGPRDSMIVDTILDTKSELNLPLRFQGGLVYHPRNTFRTTFSADVVYMPWSDVDDGLFRELIGDTLSALNDTWEVRFGLEHVFYNDLPARIGFRYGESYGTQEGDRATFTFGFGYLLKNMRVDLAGEVGKRITRQDPIRNRAPQGNVGLNRDRVEDTAVRVFLGADYTF